MTSPLHSKQTLQDGIHSIVALSYATSASRASATGFAPEDRYKLAIQLSDNTAWLLIDTGSIGPPQWVSIGFSDATSTIFATDGTHAKTVQPTAFGTNGVYTTQVGQDVFFYVSGALGINSGKAVFGGDVVVSGSVSSAGGFSGSLTTLANGQSYLVAGANVTITSQSNGQVTVSSMGGGSSTTVTGTWRDGVNSLITTGSVSIDGLNRPPTSIGQDTFFFVSGTVGLSGAQARRVVLGGDTFSSGTFIALQGFTGSLTTLVSGIPYITAIGGVSISTGSQGQLTISSSVSAGNIASLTGSGATSVTNVGTAYTVSSSYTTVVGAGGSSVSSTDGGLRFIVSSSITTVSGLGGTSVTSTDGGYRFIISSSINADTSASYVLQAPNANLPNALVIQGIGAVTTAVNGSNLQVSASLVTVTGSGGTSVTSSDGGSRYIASSSITTVSGLGGISVSSSDGGYRYIVSGSVVNVAGVGGSTVTSDGGTQFTVSSSVTSVTGSGGTTVTATDGGARFIVSSSVFVVTGSGGTTVTATDGGARFIVSSSFAAATSPATNTTQGTIILTGDLSGSAISPTVVSASIPAGIYPKLGSGFQNLSPDGVNLFDEQRGNWIALTSDAPVTVFTLPAAVPSGSVATITCEIHITMDGTNDFGVWRRSIFVRNNGGTLQTPAGGTPSDTDNSGLNNLSSGVVNASSKIDVTVNPPIITVTRPSGVPCHARLEVVDYPRGSSGA